MAQDACPLHPPLPTRSLEHRFTTANIYIYASSLTSSCPWPSVARGDGPQKVQEQRVHCLQYMRTVRHDESYGGAQLHNDDKDHTGTSVTQRDPARGAVPPTYQYTSITITPTTATAATTTTTVPFERVVCTDCGSHPHFFIKTRQLAPHTCCTSAFSTLSPL